jgi:hypothetical protein
MDQSEIVRIPNLGETASYGLHLAGGYAILEHKANRMVGHGGKRKSVDKQPEPRARSAAAR